MKLADLSALAGLELPKQNHGLGKAPSLWIHDVLLLLGIALGLLVVLAAGIYVWARLRRRRKRHVSGGQKVYRGSDSEELAGDEPEEEEAEMEHHQHDNSRRRYKYRVRRRTHRSRNPTLSETGGLPPAKSREPSQPC